MTSLAARLALSTLLVLPGCATNAIRLDRAETMTEAGRAATDSTRALVNEVVAANRAVRIDIVALDPNCSLPEPVIARGAADSQTVFCRRIPAGDDDRLSAITRAQAGPSLAVIEALTAYLDTVDAVLIREPVDLVKQLGEAEGDLRAVLAIGGASEALPALTSGQRAAVESALSLIGVIVDEAKRVDDLRRLETAIVAGTQGEQFDETIGKLNAANSEWWTKLNVQVGDQEVLIRTQLNRTPSANFEARRAYGGQLLSLVEKREAMPGFKGALDQTVSTLAAAHKDYLDLLSGSGTLTKDERRKAAALTRARVRGALRSLAALITAF